METTREIKDRLLTFGIKPSLQRIAIMRYLFTHATHPTVETIFNDLYPSIPTLSKTTVYNTLKLFTEQGAALSLNIDEKSVRYDGDISNHAHFRCKTCGDVYDLLIDESNKTNIVIPEGFQFTECQVNYKGYCKSCKETAEAITN